MCRCVSACVCICAYNLIRDGSRSIASKQNIYHGNIYDVVWYIVRRGSSSPVVDVLFDVFEPERERESERRGR